MLFIALVLELGNANYTEIASLLSIMEYAIPERQRRKHKVYHLYFTRWKRKVRTKELWLVDTVKECHISSLQTTAFCLL